MTSRLKTALGGADAPPKVAETNAGPAPKLSAKEVLAALRRSYPAQEWVFLAGLRAGTGWGQSAYDPAVERYRTGRGAKAVEQVLDAWAIQQWSPRRTLAFEIKVSRGDFLRELKDPAKRAFALLVSAEFYFVAPAGLIRLEELPEECGLIEVNATGAVHTRRRAPTRPLERPDWNFVRSAMRRVRREMYEQGPGHAGQCGGHAWLWVTIEPGSEDARRGYSGRRWQQVDLAARGQWCAKEAGHNGDCLVSGPALGAPEATSLND